MMGDNLIELKQWKDGNEMCPPYICCEDFNQAEKQELILWTVAGCALHTDFRNKTS